MKNLILIFSLILCYSTSAKMMRLKEIVNVKDYLSLEDKDILTNIIIEKVLLS